MARRTDDTTPSVSTAHPQRRSRITEARGYHPRARTAAEAPASPSKPAGPMKAAGPTKADAPASRPDLRLVATDAPAKRSTDAPAKRSTDAPATRTTARGTSGKAATTAGSSVRATASRANVRAVPRPTQRDAGAEHDHLEDEVDEPASRARAARAANAARRSERPTPRTLGPRTQQDGSGADRRPRPATPRLADSQKRLRVGTVLILALFLLIGGRLVQIQLTDAKQWAADGLNQRIEEIQLPAPRGSILDRNGSLLAGSADARYVFADPGLVKDPAGTAAKLVKLLGVPASELLPKLTPHRRDDGTEVRFEYLARGVPVAIGDAVTALGLDGIRVERDESRRVPGHDLAANLIGFTGRDLNGLAGLEAAYEELLAGVDGSRMFEIGQRDGEVNLDHEIPGGFNQTTPARPGSSIQLTIDRDLQYEVQRILGAKMSAVKADMGAAVVLDVRTGEVLAQASYPFYDAANPLAFKASNRVDNASGFVVEPGSVHKGIVFAACLQEGIITPTSTLRVPPTIVKGDEEFEDTHYHSNPTLTMPAILAWSSNVGTITLADKLGAQKLYEYQRAFGLGDLTGEGLPGESGGLVQPPENWSETSHGSVPIGHGVSVTPLQMAAVYAAIANGGTWVQPHLLKATIAPDGTVTPNGDVPSRQVISAQNATDLRTMLEAVVTMEGATGRTAAVDHYRVAGKTGTGRVIKNGAPVPGEVASFIGMAPADAPRFVIAVFAHTPGGGGGTIAGPAFADMMQYTLLHYRVAPTGTPPPRFRAHP